MLLEEREALLYESLAGGQTLLHCYLGHRSASQGGSLPGYGLSTNLTLQCLSTNPRSAGFLCNSRGEIHPSSYTGQGARSEILGARR